MNDMHLLIINPNTTEAMTRDIEKVARQYASPTTKITALNPADGPASIQGPEDGAASLPGLYALFDREMASTTSYDAVIIACFDDTGLQELKARSSIPVIGIGEAAFHCATLLGDRFSTVTTLSVSIPIIEENIACYGFEKHSAKVRASEVPVLNVGNDTMDVIAQEAKVAIKEDGCKSIVLGCAGMADLATTLSEDLQIPIIDGVASATLLSETLIRMRR